MTVAEANKVKAAPVADSTTVTNVVAKSIKSANVDDNGKNSSANTKTSTKAKLDVRPNILHGYPSYTYGLTLHLLTKDDFNNIFKQGGARSIRPSKTLISSAMRYPTTNTDGTGRDPAFLDDFYFDNFKMETVIGYNANQKGTNAVTLEFTIIEPYGMTLLDRIMDIQTKEMGARNYLSMPYLLELNFFGADDSGKMGKIYGQDKWFPIQLTGFKIKASNTGTTYGISAVPYSHNGLLQNIQTTPANFEVTYTKIIDFFQNSADTVVKSSLAAQAQSGADTKRTKLLSEKASTQQNYDKALLAYKEAQNKLNAANTNLAFATNVGSTEEQLAPLKKAQAAAADLSTRTATGLGDTALAANNAGNAALSAPPAIGTTSYTEAYNIWWQEAAKKTGADAKAAIEVPDQISFEFPTGKSKDGTILRSIGEYNIVDPTQNPIQKTPMAGSASDAATANNVEKNCVTPSASFTFNKSTVTVKAGDSITTILNQAIINSEYIREQIVNSENSNKPISPNGITADQLQKLNGNKPIRWFKIIPTVELVKFDNIRNTWGKKVIFSVIPYLYYNDKDSRAPASTPTDANAVKDYNYFYTGQNADVIDFNMDFDTLYFTAIDIDLGKTASINNTATETNTNGVDSVPPLANGGVVQVSQNPQAGAASSGMNTSTSSDNQLASSLAKNLASKSRGDMLNVMLKIVGDPDFIKQDDILYTPTNNIATNEDRYIDGGSLNMDSGQIFCKLTFNTPVDINETTGLLRKDSKYSVSKFSGLYQIITVTNEFNQGKFLQTLNMVRHMNQDRNDSTRTQGAKGGSKEISPPGVALPQIPIPKTEPVPKKSPDDTSKAAPINTAPSITQNPLAVVVPNIDKLKAVATNGETVSVTKTPIDGSPVIGDPVAATTIPQI